MVAGRTARRQLHAVCDDVACCRLMLHVARYTFESVECCALHAEGVAWCMQPLYLVSHGVVRMHKCNEVRGDKPRACTVADPAALLGILFCG